MRYPILYKEWMQRLFVITEEVGVSQYVLEEFIQAWDKRMVVLMDKNFWPTNMPGRELETVCIDLETVAEQSLQIELFQEGELAG